MNWDALILGLVSLLFGLIGLIIKSNLKEEQKGSITTAHVLTGTYSLLGAGIFFIIWSFFSE
jgi:hypothetical protein